MCRHLGYLGPPVPVGDILTRGTHSLRAQSWAPREMRGGGTINADGFGVAWWVPVAVPADAVRDPGARDRRGELSGTNGATHTTGRTGVMASRYRNPAPIWTDPAVEEVLPQLRSTAVLGAVRSATVGMPVERTACAPFTHGRWAFSHNGVVPDWKRVLTDVAAEFGTPTLLDAESATDSAVLWEILRGLLESPGLPTDSGDVVESDVGPARWSQPTWAQRKTDDSASSATAAWRSSSSSAVDDVALTPEALVRQADPATALRLLARAVLTRAPRARLNLLLGDGETLWATIVYHSLSVLVTDDVAVVASEPYDDDPRWQAIADRQLVTARPGHLAVDSLQSDESERARS
ncbi:hypothetical protein [Nocardia mexicana]|uniref:Gamma-glutamyl-hercynylcysteine sulfoxide hydrolase n=1 Tax=Nocardia mexicana TaxID=279262 RepID=A0A370H9S4_9NOCA|nr:glutamine amidotransferase [Nocardia mexicana]